MTRPARKMKPSGIPWIGDVPADWESRRFRRAGRFVKGKLPSNDNSNAEGLPIIGASEMNGKPPRTFTTDSSCPQCEKDDVLILWDGANAGFVAQGFAGTLSSTVVKYRCEIPETCPRYVFYLLKYFETYFRNKVNGTTIPHMNPAFIDDCALLLPPTETQKKIAEFLDEKCAEIDALIAVEEKMIAELKSYKQSVITEAVTRGVPAAANAARPLKDSGIPWLGSVPAHWEIRKIKSLGLLQGGNGFPEEFQGCFNEVIPFIKVKSLSENPIVVNGKDTISETTRAKLKAIIIPKNSIVFAKVGAALLLHRFRKLEFSTCIDNNMMAFIPSVQILPDFFVYAASLLDFSLFVNPGTVPSVNQEQVGNISVPCPDIKAQQKIVDFLDLKAQKIDSMISLKQEKFTSLQNYKRSIIFEYVTGKKEV